MRRKGLIWGLILFASLIVSNEAKAKTINGVEVVIVKDLTYETVGLDALWYKDYNYTGTATIRNKDGATSSPMDGMVCVKGYTQKQIDIIIDDNPTGTVNVRFMGMTGRGLIDAGVDDLRNPVNFFTRSFYGTGTFTREIEEEFDYVGVWLDATATSTSRDITVKGSFSRVMR